MKNVALMLLGMALVYACQPVADDAAEDPVVHDGINWTGDNEIANHMAWRGMHHFLNVEFVKARTFFEEAVRLDPTLFASHVMLAAISSGETSDMHAAMAKQHVVNENETSKIFVSTVENINDTTNTEVAKKWAKMHELSNGPFIHYFYAVTLSDTEKSLEELDKLYAFCQENGMASAHIHNIKGYLLQSLDRLDEGVAEIEKYVEAYPDGYNPIDSRAEFYLFQGDTANAIAHYEKVLELAPYARAARNRLDQLKE